MVNGNVIYQDFISCLISGVYELISIITVALRRLNVLYRKHVFTNNVLVCQEIKLEATHLGHIMFRIKFEVSAGHLQIQTLPIGASCNMCPSKLSPAKSFWSLALPIVRALSGRRNKWSKPSIGLVSCTFSTVNIAHYISIWWHSKF